MQTLPYGSTWSNRQKDGKLFKNLGPEVQHRLPIGRLLKMLIKRIIKGREPPKDGYKAFGEKWHRKLSAATDLEKLRTSDPAADHVFWIGHATSLLCLASGTNILFDPIFSYRASPFTRVGPARKFPAATSIDELPNIDIVTISHDHFDHLDGDSLVKIYKRFPQVQFVVPLGINEILEELKIPKTSIISRDWWEERRVKDVVLACTPAQHWGKRSLMDRNSHLWCGWVIGWGEGKEPGAPASATLFSESSQSAVGIDHASPEISTKDEEGIIPTGPTVDWHQMKTFYFTGDTSYNEQMFRLIHTRFPHIDMAALPIGAYHPREFMAIHHIDPENAAKAFNILQVRRAYGVHWGTFELAEDPIDEPPEVLAEARKAEGIPEDAFITMPTGSFLAF